MKNSMPIRVQQFRLPDFVNWLVSNGAEIVQITNPYEVVRYRAYAAKKARAELNIVYRKDNGLLTFPRDTRKHYQAFLDGKTLTGVAIPKADRAKGGTIAPTKAEERRARLIQRDGSDCWFCGRDLGDDITIEHLVARSKGGVNHLDNYALAHAKCNQDAADKTLVEKIDMRARLRAEQAA